MAPPWPGAPATPPRCPPPTPSATPPPSPQLCTGSTTPTYPSPAPAPPPQCSPATASNSPGSSTPPSKATATTDTSTKPATPPPSCTDHASHRHPQGPRPAPKLLVQGCPVQLPAPLGKPGPDTPGPGHHPRPQWRGRDVPWPHRPSRRLTGVARARPVRSTV